ncbi:MAG: hypothetical protein JWQ10_60, partial [Herbaspirillum sp.]|nr:hypothetical protein [Herbaspirillum sp.]
MGLWRYVVRSEVKEEVAAGRR